MCIQCGICNSAGIDYGKSALSNRDPESMIHYGVISLNNVNQEWLSEFQAHYAELACEKCGSTNSAVSEDDENFRDCASCGHSFYDAYESSDPISYTYERDGIQAEYSPDSSMNILFIFKSPVIVRCKFCSPCVPGAGDLDSLFADGIEAFGLPDDCLSLEVRK